ncbi:MAG: hypothetical protein ABI400_01430 [Lacisediminihabitans sp.]
MIRPHAIIALLIVGLGIVTVSGCTSAPAPNHEWSDRMTALLSDPSGQGGAGGVLSVDNGAKSANGVVELASVPSGEYDVLAVCTGAGTVHIVIKTSASHGKVLNSSDIACGATLRLPITTAAPGIAFEAASNGTPAQWQAALVTPGWGPTPTTYSR